MHLAGEAALLDGHDCLHKSHRMPLAVAAQDVIPVAGRETTMIACKGTHAIAHSRVAPCTLQRGPLFPGFCGAVGGGHSGTAVACRPRVAYDPPRFC
jgi:hypothetical protein